MALKLIEDFFEIGANPENILGSGWSVNGGRVSGSGAVQNGGGSAGTGQWIAYANQGWSAPINELFVGFALRTSTTLSGQSIISFWGNGNTQNHLTLSMDGSNRLQLFRGDPSTGTLLGTSPIPFTTLNQWRSINIRLKMSSGVAGVDGAISLKVDGNVLFENNAVVTRNGGPADVGIDGMRVNLPTASQNTAALCDLVLCDASGDINNSFPQDVAVIRRLPNANGTYHEFIGSDGNYTDNYLLVDDVPTDTTTYTFATGDGQKDSYGIEDLPAATISVKGVRAVAKTSKSGAGIAGMSVFVRESGTDTFGPSVPLSTSYAWQGDAIREKAPSTGAPWTVADVNALEIGVRSEAS